MDRGRFLTASRRAGHLETSATLTDIDATEHLLEGAADGNFSRRDILDRGRIAVWAGARPRPASGDPPSISLWYPSRDGRSMMSKRRAGPRLGTLVICSALAACADDPAGDSSASGESGSASTDGTETGSGSGESTGTESGSESGTESESETTDATETGGSQGSPGCGQAGPGAGTHGRDVEVGDETRSYDLFVPDGYDPDTPAPLVLNFHGLYGSPSQQVELTDFNATAQSRGMLVAYPEGIGASFNAGACCGDAASQDVDDVGFARALVEQVANDLCVDPKRVYATGMSNGGHMVHTLGCEAADVFAAVGSVTGVMGLGDGCNPSRSVSVIDFHGTGDFVVPYGGAGPGFPPVDEMMEDWAARNGCAGSSQPTLDQGDVHCETWPDCEGGVEVTLCTIDGGGHCWPGNPTCLFGSANTDVEASEMIADMFLAHPLP